MCSRKTEADYEREELEMLELSKKVIKQHIKAKFLRLLEMQDASLRLPHKDAFFLPQSEILSHKPCSDLKSIQHTRKFTSRPTRMKYQEFHCYGRDLTLSSLKLGRPSMENKKFRQDSVVGSWCVRKLKFNYKGFSGKYFDVLPIIVFTYHRNDEDIIISLEGIAGTTCAQVRKHLRVRFIDDLHGYEVFVFLKNVVVLSQRALVIATLVPKKNNRSFRLMEICRESLRQKKFPGLLKTIHFSNVENKVLIEMIRSGAEDTSHYLLSYDIETNSFDEPALFFKSDSRVVTRIHYVTHCEYPHGLVICFMRYFNLVKLLTKFEEDGQFQFVKNVNFDFGLDYPDYPPPIYKCAINRNNQILMFFADHKKIMVYDLFDQSNKTLIYEVEPKIKEDIDDRGTKALNLKVCVSVTGEEIFVYNDNTINAYLYRSAVKSLVSLCVTFIEVRFSQQDLFEMKMPGGLRLLFKES